VKWFVPLILISCSQIPIKPYRSVDPELMPYVKDFERDYNLSLEKVTARFYNLDLIMDDRNVVGICEYNYHDNTKNKVFIDTKYWTFASGIHRKMLVYHELGHCVLHRKHRRDKLKNGCPTSLMNPSILKARCFYRNEEYYITELWENRNEL